MSDKENTFEENLAKLEELAGWRGRKSSSSITISLNRIR